MPQLVPLNPHQQTKSIPLQHIHQEKSKEKRLILSLSPSVRIIFTVQFILGAFLIMLVTLKSAASLRTLPTQHYPLRVKLSTKYQLQNSHSKHRSLRLSSRLFASSSKDWPVENVRSTFVKYFEEKHAHVNYKSSPCVPLNDPTLLFTNAGMNQFKPIFIGTVDPTSPLASLKRAANSQKCIRAGGKHNDLEDVGKDTYHHTFFEMLGTWSFGDYFKKEAIDMAYDILVNEYKLDPNRLYASYFGGDEAMGLPCDTEARDYWLQYLPIERVLPFDKKANFWEMGDTGPCGPCSEIHFDRIGNRDASHLVNADDPNVIEIWNLVFIQFNREPDGSLRSLPNKHIDTGMGLERLTSILQQKPSNYDTDVFMPLFQAIQASVGSPPYTGLLGAEDAKQNYRDTAYRVVADHIRTLTFSITDGAVPANEGRGYVLRRVLRRAVRYGMQTLGASAGFLSSLVPTVVAHFGEAFPELREKQSFVMSIIREEEEAFASLLEKGVKYFQEVADEVKRSPDTVMIPGDKAFFLYDTLGFPIDLTQIMAAEQGLTVDTRAFEAAMLLQKERSRQATKSKRLAGRVPLALGAEQVAFLQQQLQAPVTRDEVKYQHHPTFKTQLAAVYTAKGFVTAASLAEQVASLNTNPNSSNNNTMTVGLVLKDTSFYAESGGQVADTGKITISLPDNNGNGNLEKIVFEVVDVQSYGGYILHTCVLAEEEEEEVVGAVRDAHQQESLLLRFFSHAAAKSTSSPLAAVVDVDYVKRARVAPNHSMTHVLHWALQSILSTNTNTNTNTNTKNESNAPMMTMAMKIEQRGSLVSEEKLRFDFSASRALSTAEIERVEAQVNDIIRQALPVHNDVVKLKDAQRISGLRAVFGEVYPDPVRVLSVGPTVSELLQQPENSHWQQFSIEFCGGTHIQNTQEAQAFVIIEETAVAKGIRRITGLTGHDAVQTITRSHAMEKNVASFQQQLEQLTNHPPVAVTEDMIKSLETTLASLRHELESHVLRQVTKTQCREQCDLLQRQLLQLQNKFIANKVEGLLCTVIAQAQELEKQGKQTAVFTLPMNSDAKMMKRTVDELKKAAPSLSFVCIATADAEKIPVFALVTESMTQSTGLKANDWIVAMMASYQGRGGGKANNAQGTIVRNTVNTATATQGNSNEDEEVVRGMKEASTKFLLSKNIH